MKRKALLTAVLCNVVGLLLFLAGVAGTVGLLDTSWGKWLARMPDTQPGFVASEWLERSILIERWVTFPLISFVVGVIAAFLYRRADWRISSLCCLSLIYLTISGLPISIERILAALLYFVTSWAGMRLVSPLFAKESRLSQPTQIAAPPT